MGPGSKRENMGCGHSEDSKIDLTPEMVERVEKLFDAIDLDKGGSLDRGELCNFAGMASGQGDYLEKLQEDIMSEEGRKALDADGNGNISKEEFVELFHGHYARYTGKKGKEGFSEFLGKREIVA